MHWTKFTDQRERVIITLWLRRVGLFITDWPPASSRQSQSNRASAAHLLKMRDRLFLISGLLGISALAMTLILALIGPRATGPLPPGFITPIMAFEFAESEAEVYRLFEPDGSAAAMDRVNRWDFLYMALYSGFLGAFALALARHTKETIYISAAILALVIFFADVMENMQLLGLTYRMQLDGGSLEGTLGRLRAYTWLKWGGLALYFLLLVPYFRGLSGPWRWVWPAALLPATLAVVAFLSRGLANELLALSIGFMFLLLTGYALWRSSRPHQVSSEQ